jgi:hypothetical protein
MGILGKMLGKEEEKKSEECVLVYLKSATLLDESEPTDLSTLFALEEELIAAIEQKDAGEFDGNEVGPDGATLFAYGPDAQELYSAMEPVLLSNPLCDQARVVVRKGPPGSPQTELRLGVHGQLN